MKNTIVVSGVNEAPLLDCRVEVDDYVPLRFRSYHGTLGIKYLRLGNFSGSLLELLLDPESMTIRGFTLTSFDAVHQPKTLTSANLPMILGLPIVAFGNEAVFQGPVDAQRIDIDETFSVGFGTNFVEIDFGHLCEAQSVIKSGLAEFCVNMDFLVGLRVVGLNQQQMTMLRAHKNA